MSSEAQMNHFIATRIFFTARILVFALLLGFPPAEAQERIRVDLVRTIDGDTARFIVNGSETRVRFLAVDAPGKGFSGARRQPGAAEATQFVDRMLRSASVIELELDPSRPGRDRLWRLRAWVWADGVLVQEALVRESHAKTAFLDPGMTHYRRIRAAEAGPPTTNGHAGDGRHR